MSTSQLSKLALTLTSTLLLLSTASAQYKIGSTNTATADPPVPRPKTTPCVVELFKGFEFENFTPQSFDYTPPANCPGPWAAVIFEGNFSISAGIQYDRTANVWLGPTNIYFGTTAEDAPGEPRNWHVERDLTDYSSIFTTPQVGTVDLFNVHFSPYLGVLRGAANLLFYPVASGQNPPSSADQVIAFSGGPTGSTVALDTTGACCQPSLSETVTFPTNVESLFLDVFSQSQHDDEFWYTCVPTDLYSTFGTCANTAFRESEISIDGVPAGVAPVYPWIFTGAYDPFLWYPIPGVQTLNFKPYRVNLTPFAAVLDDGNPHTITLSVFNADDYFSATASLLVYLDHNATQVTGAVTSNTLTAPSPTVTTNVGTAKNGNVQGSITTKNAHNFAIMGYANTSHGLVTTTVEQQIDFSNVQNWKLSSTEYKQNITQGTTIHSVVTTQDSTGKTVYKVNHTWPLTFDVLAQVNPDGSQYQITSTNQYFEADEAATKNGDPINFQLAKNRVTTTDTLNFDSSGNFTGNTNQASTQDYFGSNSTGYCYSVDLTAAANALTSVTEGQGCN
jgi:hypothetical protein